MGMGLKSKQNWEQQQKNPSELYKLCRRVFKDKIYISFCFVLLIVPLFTHTVKDDIPVLFLDTIMSLQF